MVPLQFAKVRQVVTRDFDDYAALFTSLARDRWKLARELGPKGIHVAHLIIDAGVDTNWVRERIKAREGEAAVA